MTDLHSKLMRRAKLPPLVDHRGMTFSELQTDIEAEERENARLLPLIEALAKVAEASAINKGHNDTCSFSLLVETDESVCDCGLYQRTLALSSLAGIVGDDCGGCVKRLKNLKVDKSRWQKE